MKMNYEFLKTDAQRDPTVHKYLQKSINDTDLKKGFQMYSEAVHAGGGFVSKDFSSGGAGQLAAESTTYIEAVKKLSTVLDKARVIPMKSDTLNVSPFSVEEELFVISENAETSPRATGSVSDRTLNTTLLGMSKRYSHKWLRNGPFATVGEALNFVQAQQFQAVVNGIGRLSLLGTGSTGFLQRLSGDGWIGQANVGNGGQVQTVSAITASAGASYTAREVTQSLEDLITAIDTTYIDNFQTQEKYCFVAPIAFEAARLQNKNSVLASEAFLATPTEMPQGLHTIIKEPLLGASSSLVYSVVKSNLIAGIGFGGQGFAPNFEVKWFPEFNAWEVFHTIDFDVQTPEISGSILGLILQG